MRKLSDKSWKLHCLPNLISLSRILLAPLFLISLKNYFTIIACIILITGAITDFFDGYIARKIKSTSRIGAILDPLADKVFTNTVIWSIILYHDYSLVLLIIAILLTARDLTLILYSGYYILKKTQIEIKPLYLSKMCTTLFLLLCIGILIFDNSNLYIQWLQVITIIMVGLTSILYFKRLTNYTKR
jgi:CDP-diacylglycerol--glycerol-3-phosphate 3-phosphatidyltransferase